MLGVDWEMVENSSGSPSDMFDKIVSLVSSVCFFSFTKIYSTLASLAIAPNLPRALVFEHKQLGQGPWCVGCMMCHSNFIDDAKCSKSQGS